MKHCSLIALVTLAGKAAVILLMATNLPHIDAWIGSILRTAVPLHEGHYDWGKVFSLYNEHRIFWTRIEDVTQYAAMGHWSNLAECWFNAALHTAILCFLFRALSKELTRKYHWILAVSVCLIGALPFAWENTIEGFESQSYWLLGFSLLTIYFLAVKRSWIGIPLAIAGLFTMASGFVAPLVCLPFLFKRLRIFTAVIGVLIWGIAIQGHDYVWPEYMKDHQAPALSVWQFLCAFGRCIAWPGIFLPVLGLIALWPFVRLVRFLPKTPFLWATLLWVIMQCGAMAYARGQEGFYPPSRYGDTLALMLPLSVVALCILHELKAEKILLPIWSASTVFGLLALMGFTFCLDLPRRWLLQQVWRENTKLIYGWEPVPAGWFGQFPYPDEKGYADVLHYPGVVEVMPDGWCEEGWPHEDMRHRFQENYRQALRMGAESNALETLRHKANQ